MIQVTVADGRVVRNERNELMPTNASFEINERSMFWSRLLRDGDVIAVATGDTTSTTAATATTTATPTATATTASTSSGSSATPAASTTTTASKDATS